MCVAAMSSYSVAICNPKSMIPSTGLTSPSDISLAVAAQSELCLLEGAAPDAWSRWGLRRRCWASRRNLPSSIQLRRRLGDGFTYCLLPHVGADTTKPPQVSPRWMSA